MGYNESKYIKLKINERVISISNWYSAGADREYMSSYEINKDYRKAFCVLVFNRINRKYDEENLKIEDVEAISDEDLIKIINLDLENNIELHNYFKVNYQEDYFEAFYLAKKIKREKGFESFQQVINSTSKITEDFYKSIKPAFEQVNNLFNEIKNQYSSIFNFEEISKVIERLSEFDGELEKFKAIIMSLGFPPHMELLPYDISRIVSIYNKYGEEKAKEETYNIYLQYFNNENIKDMSNEWFETDIVKKRKDIINQAINAHIQGNYYLSIPIVFSQIEGMIANVFNHKGQMSGGKYLEHIKQLLDSKENYSFDSLISTFYSNIILVTFGHNEPIKSFLSRHAIMHGGDTEYGTEINSIKALALFDYIIKKINEYKNKENEKLAPI